MTPLDRTLAAVAAVPAGPTHSNSKAVVNQAEPGSVPPQLPGPAAARPAPQLPVGAADLDAESLGRVWAAVAGSTSAAHRSDWSRLRAWGSDRGLGVLPADPVVVAAYLTEAAAQQHQTAVGESGFGPRWRYSSATLSRWCLSINQVHTAAGHPAPGHSEIVRRALSGVRRTRAAPPARRAPLLLQDIQRLLEAMPPAFSSWPAGVISRRDAAILLLLRSATAARRSELVCLTLADVRVHRVDGLHLTVRRPGAAGRQRGPVPAGDFRGEQGP